MLDPSQVRSALARWYRRSKRELPWRRTRDPYRIWVSEVMLQQTRVAAVTPFYVRFLDRFPDVQSLAAAPESAVLAAWAGLGYYSRARNLHKAAKLIAAAGAFPNDYEGIRALPGVGDYTAAAVASIAWGLPHAVLDGNVMRVLARLSHETGDLRSGQTRSRLRAQASTLVDAQHPGDYNQAIMELGATVCLPREPQCLVCPLREFCEASRLGAQDRVPVKSRGRDAEQIELALLAIRNGRRWLLRQRPQDSGQMAGFWEPPEVGQLPGVAASSFLGRFQHTITYHRYRVSVFAARATGDPTGCRWVGEDELATLPLSTLARKALALARAGKSGKPEPRRDPEHPDNT